MGESKMFILALCALLPVFANSATLTSTDFTTAPSCSCMDSKVSKICLTTGAVKASAPYVYLVVKTAHENTGTAIAPNCETEVSVDTEACLTVKMDGSQCFAPASVADTDVTLSALLTTSNMSFVDGEITQIDCTCKFDTNGNEVQIVDGPNVTISNVPAVLPAAKPDLGISAEVRDTTDNPKSTCVINGIDTDRINIVVWATKKTGVVEGLAITYLRVPLGGGKYINIIENGCSKSGLRYIDANVGSKVHTFGGMDGSKAYITLSATLKCFSVRGLSTITFEIGVVSCSTANASLCLKGCTTDTRVRRSADDDRMISYTYNVTTALVPINPREDFKGYNLCSEYTSNTVFYAVIAVLAVLLVLTIGVATYFGARAREVILKGKDNPSYS